jgi:P27 family predicted phage terminase small subunit
MRGRKPTPTAIKLLKGYRRDRVNSDEPPATPARPDVPPGLDAVGRQQFARVCDLLEPLRILSKADGPIVALYAHHFSRWRAAEAQVRKLGLLLDGARGTKIANPAVRIAHEAAAAMARLLVELGMSPSARSRIRATPAAPADTLDTFIKRAHESRSRRPSPVS